MIEKIDNEFLKSAIENDVFKRNKRLVSLLTQISELDEQKWIAVDGAWGSGKTIFVKELEYLINNLRLYKQLCVNQNIAEGDIEHLEVFYFDSWENDALNVPVLYLMLQLVSKYGDIDKLTKESLINRGFKELIKFITDGNINFDEICKVDNIFNEINRVNKVKEIFNSLIDSILEERKNKIVIIIDELDRCKPSYSVELLETLKHFYTNDKIIFVFSVNIIQLSKTVKKQYGDEYDGELYLSRFFDKTISLNSYKRDDYIKLYLKYDIQSFCVLNSVCRACINYFDLSIRETIKFIKLVKYNSVLLSENDFHNDGIFFSRIIILIIGLANQCKTIEGFNDYINGNFTDFRKLIECDKELIQWFDKNISYRIHKISDLIESVDRRQYLLHIYDIICKGKEDYDNKISEKEKNILITAWSE